MAIFDNDGRLHTIWHTPYRAHFVVAIGLTPLFALIAIWGWYANAAEVESRNHDLTHNSGDPLAAHTAGETDAVGGQGPPDAPSASPTAFSSISVGYDHACGLLTSGKIVCWGKNDWGQATPPDLAFKAVSAGRVASCGIRADDTVVCWGSGIAGTPGGTFSSVSVYDDACGITLAGSIMCWSGGIANQPPPPGSFRQVSVGNGYACALRTDSTLHCWGGNDHGRATPPSGAFQSVSAGFVHTCGLRADGTVACWGADWHGRTSSPSGTYRHVATMTDFSCAVRTDGIVTCWGINNSREGDAPVGDFKTVETGARFACGLKVDATVICWGSDEDGRTEPPSATGSAPVSNIAVCSGPNAGEVVISWDAVPQATHYRIGYVNMIKDYPRAKASVTGEWIEAFIYVDVNALNILVSSNGRADYTLRRLVPGDIHAFTVLTSNDVVNTRETISGAYHWPQNPRWTFLTVSDPEPGCAAAATALQKVRNSDPDSSTVACDLRTGVRFPIRADAYWGNFPVQKDGAALSGYRYTWLVPAEDGSINEFTHELGADHEGTTFLSDKALPPGTTLSISVTALYVEGLIEGMPVVADCQPIG